MIKNSLKNISKVINSGLTPLRSNPNYWINGNIPWVKTEQLGVKYIYDSNEKITKNALENTSIKLNPANTLSIAMYGEGKTRGSVSILKNETTTNQACCNVVIDKEKADFEFVYYNLKTQYDNLRNLSSGVRKNLNSNDIKNFEIYLPKLNIQKQIAKVLSDLDAKIEINNKINQELEAMAKTLYDYWFVQFDFPDKNGKPYKSSGGEMVFNEELKREIPVGWEVKYLTEEMDLQYGFPFSTKLFNSEENGVPVIRIRDILKCSISNYSTEEVDEKYKLFKGDILVGMDGNFHINYWNKEGCYLNQRSLRIRSNKNSISEIQTKYSIQPYIKAREKNVSRTTVAHLSAKDVNDLRVLKATNELQLKANKFFVTTLDKIVSNREQNQKLSELRDWLLPMLMNGQVTVGYAEKKAEGLGLVAEGGEE
jgi:type I restriction enzyme S subunit